MASGIARRKKASEARSKALFASAICESVGAGVTLRALDHAASTRRYHPARSSRLRESVVEGWGSGGEALSWAGGESWLCAGGVMKREVSTSARAAAK